MEKHALFVKTDKGRQALASRSPELGPRLRSLLIMVDGKRSAAELDKLGAGLGGGLLLLEQLEAAGWVERVHAGGALFDSAAAPVQADVPIASEPVAAATAVLPFREARQLVARFINDQLGPMGEALALRVESCRTGVDLQDILPRIRESLLSFKDPATVQRFERELVARLPKF